MTKRKTSGTRQGRVEYYMGIAEKHGLKRTIALLLDIIDGERAQAAINQAVRKWRASA